MKTVSSILPHFMALNAPAGAFHADRSPNSNVLVIAQRPKNNLTSNTRRLANRKAAGTNANSCLETPIVLKILDERSTALFIKQVPRSRHQSEYPISIDLSSKARQLNVFIVFMQQGLHFDFVPLLPKVAIADISKIVSGSLANEKLDKPEFWSP